jgi:hypothetical protein
VTEDFDELRAEAILPVLATLLGTTALGVGA